MASWKSLDPYKQILASLVTDVQNVTQQVITPSACRKTINQIEKRCADEGISFLTKTLPRLGKELDRALTGDYNIDAMKLRFKTQPNSKLPKLFGELFNKVFSSDGKVLHSPCVTCIQALRQLLFVFYKLELPYSRELEQDVLDQFVKTESDILPYHQLFSKVADVIDEHGLTKSRPLLGDLFPIVRKARGLLSRVFLNFDITDIVPRHGPGVVSTKETAFGKYFFERINQRIDRHFPFDAFFKASLGHVCDTYDSFESLIDCEAFARVLLVPKDSRGPRLISCEPLEFQWIQQGVGRAIVERVESCLLTRYNVHFTDQQPNQFGALLGSITGNLATLDLKDASDRVTVGLVRLLFPKNVSDVLLDSRTLATVLPCGRILKLNKFAPMGSALCFPILALTIWAILTACSTNRSSRERTLVYGDDVVVETAEAENAIKQLEAFGLLINRAKSCCHGFFKESCGVDAYKGINITPTRIKCLWAHHPSASVYESYLSYSNNFYKRGYTSTSNLIARMLCSKLKNIPPSTIGLTDGCLLDYPWDYTPPRRRWNKNLQRFEYYVLTVESRPIKCQFEGWHNLLRYFTEGDRASSYDRSTIPCRCSSEALLDHLFGPEPFSTSMYTRRDTSHLVKRWRG